MESELSCPICRFKDISSGSLKCPQCDADLSCFRVLDSLPDELPAEKAALKWNTRPVIWVGLLLCLAAAVFMAQHYSFKRLENRVLERQERILQAGIRDILDHDAFKGARAEIPKSDIEAGPSQSDRAENPEGPVDLKPEDVPAQVQENVPGTASVATDTGAANGFWIYEANEKDTLWGIAERYYGNGRYYPVLLEHNPRLEIYRVGRGTSLRILKEGDLAKEIFRNITGREGSALVWYYTMADGDTLESIARRFYKTEDMKKRIADFNPGVRPTPGVRIKIALE